MSQDDEKGIRVGNLESVPDRFKCSHCQLLLREPMQGDCGHRYCKNCVHIKWKEAQSSGLPSLCDACEEDDDERETISPDRTYPDRAMRVEMKRLRVRCPNEGCSEEMTLKQLESHVTECPMKPQACQNCGREVAQARMDEHRRSDCPKRPCECDACGEMVAYDELDEHKRNSCIGSTRQCEFCGVRVKDDDSSMDEHVRSDCAVPWRDGEACPYGCGDVQDWRGHRQECVTKHLDRTLARVKQLELQRPAAAAAAAASAASVESTEAGATISEEGFEEVDQSLNELNERVESLQKDAQKASLELEKSSAEAESKTQQRQQQELHLLARVLEHGEEVKQLAALLEKKHSEYTDTLNKYKVDMEKDAESTKEGTFEEEFKAKQEDLTKLLAYKTFQIRELEVRAQQLKLTSYDGVFVWKVTDLSKCRVSDKSLYSPPFFTGKPGYKLCGRLFLNGDADGRSTHVSVFVALMRHDFDALMPWPFAQHVTIAVLNHKSNPPHYDGLTFAPSKSADQSAFRRPLAVMNLASGFSKFKTTLDFFDESRGFVRNDTAYFKFTVDLTGLP